MRRTFLEDVVVGATSFYLLHRFAKYLDNVFVGLVVVYRRVVYSIVAVRLSVVRVGAYVSLWGRPSSLP